MTENIKIELDDDQLEFIQKNNIDLSALMREKLDKLISEEQEGYPSIVYDAPHDILYVDFKKGSADSVPIIKDCYIREDMETGEFIGFHIEDFFKKTDEDFRKGMLEKLKEGESKCQ